MRRVFRYLQIGTGPRRSPSACSEILKKKDAGDYRGPRPLGEVGHLGDHELNRAEPVARQEDERDDHNYLDDPHWYLDLERLLYELTKVADVPEDAASAQQPDELGEAEEPDDLQQFRLGARDLGFAARGIVVADGLQNRAEGDGRQEVECKPAAPAAL